MKTVQPLAKRRGSPLPVFQNYTIYLGISIDPGADTGWAVWLLNQGPTKMIECGIGEPPHLSYNKMVIELPQVYPSQPVPPNDLITLAFLAGRYAGGTGAEVSTVSPHEWKGNVPKEICAGRIVKALSSGEQLLVSQAEDEVPRGKRHNMLDAIGIGLYAFRNVKL